MRCLYIANYNYMYIFLYYPLAYKDAELQKVCKVIRFRNSLTLQHLYMTRVWRGGRREVVIPRPVYVIHCCAKMSAGLPYQLSNEKIQARRMRCKWYTNYSSEFCCTILELTSGTFDKFCFTILKVIQFLFTSCYVVWTVKLCVQWHYLCT
jgi:hypothetical protein